MNPVLEEMSSKLLNSLAIRRTAPKVKHQNAKVKNTKKLILIIQKYERIHLLSDWMNYVCILDDHIHVASTLSHHAESVNKERMPCHRQRDAYGEWRGTFS